MVITVLHTDSMGPPYGLVFFFFSETLSGGVKKEDLWRRERDRESEGKGGGDHARKRGGQRDIGKGTKKENGRKRDRARGLKRSGEKDRERERVEKDRARPTLCLVSGCVCVGMHSLFSCSVSE